MTEPLLSACQVAEHLGFAPGTIVDWAEAGKSRLQIGGASGFRLSEVEGWLEERRLLSHRARHSRQDQPKGGGNGERPVS